METSLAGDSSKLKGTSKEEGRPKIVVNGQKKVVFEGGVCMHQSVEFPGMGIAAEYIRQAKLAIWSLYFLLFLDTKCIFFQFWLCWLCKYPAILTC